MLIMTFALPADAITCLPGQTVRIWSNTDALVVHHNWDGGTRAYLFGGYRVTNTEMRITATSISHGPASYFYGGTYCECNESPCVE